MGIGISTFNVTVASAGTRVRLKTTTTYAQSVFFESHEANLGSLYIGNASVSTASYVKRLTAGNGFSMNARQGAYLGTDGGMIDLSQLYVDAGTAAQVLLVSYVLHIGPY